MNVWEEAKQVKLSIGKGIKPGFDCWFDERISRSTKREIRAFMKWVSNNYVMPITLQVDFNFNHFLIQRNGKRAYYLFHFNVFKDYPIFTDSDELPIIYLPVRIEHCEIEDVIYSFIRGITWYYAWLCHKNLDKYEISDEGAEEIYLKYFDDKNRTEKNPLSVLYLRGF